MISYDRSWMLVCYANRKNYGNHIHPYPSFEMPILSWWKIKPRTWRIRLWHRSFAALFQSRVRCFKCRADPSWDQLWGLEPRSWPVNSNNWWYRGEPLLVSINWWLQRWVSDQVNWSTVSTGQWSRFGGKKHHCATWNALSRYTDAKSCTCDINLYCQALDSRGLNI